MPPTTEPRLWAAVLALVTAIAVALVGESLGAGLIAAVGAIAAVLLAGMEPEHREERTADPDPEEDAAALGPVLDAIVQPVLLVRDARVVLANRAALAELGRHIVGEDVRVAIRHPAAAARLALPDGGVAERPIELVGLGSIERRWEMRVGVAGPFRIVQLIDRTGAYAAEQMRIDFVANASHELRTPLASILGFIETLSDEAGADPGVRGRFLKVMFDEARRMQRLVEDLISLSRIEAEKHRLPDERIDMAELVEVVRADIAATDAERARAVITAIESDVPAVCGDEARLSQMLHNLIGNALKYGRPGTPVTVSLRREGGMVRLSVADEGEGIAPEHIPRLTERFYRVDAGRSRMAGGTGLGLAIVKHIVERHRGRLDIASKLGVGTTVTVLLPPATDAVTKA
ncbi:ATP-binding protein [Sphingomonas lenta]|uniref:histidine kinase n=1 Tax=Sphingomonas lenta TaxID=1141887 RepID=A0A2A2SH50_9SPHN|nr:ATP-binding protein [Sphingomonas lenta]PAX08569.1 ATPase [Sphingomonas lenta]